MRVNRLRSTPLVGWRICSGCHNQTLAKPKQDPKDPLREIVLCRKCNKRSKEASAPQ